MRFWFTVAFAMAFLSTPVIAQTYQDSGGTKVPGTVPLIGCSPTGLCAGPLSNANPLPSSDPNNAAFQGVVVMTVGVVYPVQRSVGILATISGNVTFEFTDNSTINLPVFAGWQTFPFACKEIVSSGTTATASYYNMK